MLDSNTFVEGSSRAKEQHPGSEARAEGKEWNRGKEKVAKISCLLMVSSLSSSVSWTCCKRGQCEAWSNSALSFLGANWSKTK